MPQMYPMNWLFLFFMFSIMFSMIMIFYYFSNKKMMKKSLKKMKNKNIFKTWMW